MDDLRDNIHEMIDSGYKIEKYNQFNIALLMF